MSNVNNHQPINQSFILLAMVHTTVTLLSLLMVVLVQQALANHMLIWSLPLNHQFILSVAWNKVISLILFATHLEVYTYSILFCIFRMNYVEDWHILNFCHLQKTWTICVNHSADLCQRVYRNVQLGVFVK